MLITVWKRRGSSAETATKLNDAAVVTAEVVIEQVVFEDNVSSIDEENATVAFGGAMSEG